MKSTIERKWWDEMTITEIKAKTYYCKVCGGPMSGADVYSSWVRQGKRIDFDFDNGKISHGTCSVREMDRVFREASELGVRL